MYIYGNTVVVRGKKHTNMFHVFSVSVLTAAILLVMEGQPNGTRPSVKGLVRTLHSTMDQKERESL